MSPAAGRRAWPRLVLLAAFGVALAAFLVFGGERYLTLDWVKERAASLQGFTDAHYAEALALAFAIYVTAITLSLPSGTILSLTFGFLFGRWVASALVVTAGTLGATLVFLGARYLFGNAVRARLGRVGAKINEGFTRDGFSWLLFLRLMPVFPHFLVNLVPALTAIRVPSYVAATCIGILPSTLIITNLGQALGHLESTRGLLTPEALIALSLLGLLALLPVLAHYRRARRR
ncbi:MAG TPA: TVP38/TMEM64 family protein [Casimicrobiaceae bacterium]|nr:TVP38/TMEM64 family protein [Casimicrobiaceae bacterium]